MLLSFAGVYCCFGYIWGNVKINEILYDPEGSDSGKEWIELYNCADSSVNLQSWQIYSGGSSFALVYTFPDVTIEGKSFLVVGALDFCDLQKEFSFQNGGTATDGVKLVSSDGSYCDVLLYDSPNSNSLAIEDGTVGNKFAPDVSSGSSLARKIDGQDSDNCEVDFAECTEPTPGKTNVKEKPVFEKWQTMKISELYYDPPGSDGDSEWIELYNPADSSINLCGWQIYAGGTSYSLLHEFDSCLVSAKSFVVIGANPEFDVVKKLSFQNGGSATDGVKLVSPDASYCDVLLYDSPNSNELTNENGEVGESFADDVSEGNSLARINLDVDFDRSNLDFASTKFLTPGVINKFPVSLKLSEFYRKNQKLYTKITNLSTFDLQTDFAKISLSCNDSILLEHKVGFVGKGESAEVDFDVRNSSDIYQVWRANLTCELDADESDNCLVLLSVSYDVGLVINEVMCNPKKGVPEWLELYNKGTEKLVVGDAQIRDKSGDITKFSLQIDKGEYLVITDDLSMFVQFYPQVDISKIIEVEKLVSLNNSDEVLILEDCWGTKFDSVSYGKINLAKGTSLEKFGYQDLGNVWGECVDTATPGEANSVRVYQYKNRFDTNISKKAIRRGESITIGYNVPEIRSIARVHCKVYDLQGNLKRSLRNYKKSAIQGNIKFDGKDDRGKFLETGVYNVVLSISKGETMYKKRWYVTIK